MKVEGKFHLSSGLKYHYGIGNVISYSDDFIKLMVVSLHFEFPFMWNTWR